MPGTGAGYIRDEAAQLLSIWWMIRDAIEGEPAIKGEFGTRATYFPVAERGYSLADYYLPRPNCTDKSLANQERYRAYVRRALWYNFTSRTLDGLVGQIFLRPPVTTLPTELDVLDMDCDGEGLTLTQVAKRTAQSALAYGRAGLFTDFPTVAGPQTVEQIKNNNIQPIIKHYHPWSIRNWATTKRGAKHVLSLVVLEEIHMIEVDDFAMDTQIKYRILRLDPKTWIYSVEMWCEDKPADRDAKNKGKAKADQQNSTYTMDDSFTPTDSAGKTFDVIPFTFVGSEANDIWPDRPPLYDLASLNIAHYRNSADYEEACYIAGQPTPVISGLTQEWVETVLKDGMELGSRAAVMLPVGAKAELLQANANIMPFEAMKAKEEQALSLGAKLVQHQKTVRTALEVMVDTTSETSTLHNVANNVSSALQQNLGWAARFAGSKVATDKPIAYKLNTEFELTRMNANDRLAVVKLWQSGAIAFTEMRDVLRVDGTAQLDDVTALALIEKEQAAAALLGGAPIADPLQAVTPTAPENTPNASGGPAKPAAKPTSKPAAGASK